MLFLHNFIFKYVPTFNEQTKLEPMLHYDSPGHTIRLLLALTATSTSSEPSAAAPGITTKHHRGQGPTGYPIKVYDLSLSLCL